MYYFSEDFLRKHCFPVGNRVRKILTKINNFNAIAKDLDVSLYSELISGK